MGNHTLSKTTLCAGIVNENAPPHNFVRPRREHNHEIAMHITARITRATFQLATQEEHSERSA